LTVDVDCDNIIDTWCVMVLVFAVFCGFAAMAVVRVKLQAAALIASSQVNWFV